VVIEWEWEKVHECIAKETHTETVEEHSYNSNRSISGYHHHSPEIRLFKTRQAGDTQNHNTSSNFPV